MYLNIALPRSDENLRVMDLPELNDVHLTWCDLTFFMLGRVAEVYIFYV